MPTYDPELKGLSIEDFAVIANAIIAYGTETSKRHYEWEPILGIPLVFRVSDEYYYQGYKLRYHLSCKGGGGYWRVECAGSMFPPGNTTHGQGWYNNAPYAHVELDCVRGRNNKGRYIFGFNLWCNEEAYTRDMAVIRLMVEGWQK